MPLVGPPGQIAYAVERLAPGIYQTFWSRVRDANLWLRVTPTNYYRSRSHNARVGGSANSQHLIATALDLVYASQADRRAGIERMRRAGLIAIDEGDHVHVQAWPANVAIRVIQSVGV